MNALKAMDVVRRSASRRDRSDDERVFDHADANRAAVYAGMEAVMENVDDLASRAAQANGELREKLSGGIDISDSLDGLKAVVK